MPTSDSIPAVSPASDSDLPSYKDLLAETIQLRTLLGQQMVSACQMVEFVRTYGSPITKVAGGAAHLLSELLGQQLYESDPENYIQLSFDSAMYPVGGDIVVTLQRTSGLTPHELRLLAEEESEQQKQRCILLKDALDNQLRQVEGKVEGPVFVESALAKLIESPAVSEWLKSALKSALDRDCVDAANDAEILADLLGRRCNSLLMGATQHLLGQG
ncbi:MULTISPECIES: hypothetical protein [unclassified Pseudomonas]|uniref:hypothetical protein n=1 Tax=unclassified Pseudomonas TaxID=196821 RepID=UPI00192E1E50|nr:MULTISPECIES: hypothetical protein [unclassified Pseudomonas]